MEWKVLEDEPLPAAELEERPRRRVLRKQWALLGIVLAGFLLVGAWWIRQQVEANEAQLREDIAQAVAAEEQARSFGAVEQVRALADLGAPEAWRLRYEALFRHPPADAKPPDILSVEHKGGLALVTLAEGGKAGWPRARAYRLVRNQWRRTPVPATFWESPTAYHSDQFTLWMSDRDAALLSPDELLAYLEQVRFEFNDLWSPSYEGELILRIMSHDLMPVSVMQTNPSEEIVLTSPLLASQSRYPFLSPERAYRLALIEAVAAALDVGATTATETPAELEEIRLRQLLREATVRHLVLSEEELLQYREFAREQSTNIPRVEQRAGVPDAATLSFLIDYLVAVEGKEAPGRLAGALQPGASLQDATVQAFGLPLQPLLEEVRLWMGAHTVTEVGLPPDTPHTVKVLRVLEDDPFRALAVTVDEGRLVKLVGPNESMLPLPAHCLGVGTRLSFEEKTSSGSEISVEEIRVTALRLPTWPVGPLPSSTETVIARRVSDSTRIIALDGKGGETELMSLPEGIELVVHPREPSFGFLLYDECGVSVNQYLMRLGRITRAPVSPEGTAHLFWADQLYLLDDLSQTPEPHWAIVPIGLWEPRPALVTRRLDSTMEWKQLLGYSSMVDKRLVELQDGRLLWLDIIRWFSMRGVTLRPADLNVPATAGMKSLSTEGYWLAYTLKADENTSELYVLDIENNRSIWLHRITGGDGFGETVFGPGFVTPFLTTAGPVMQGQVYSNTLLSHDAYPTYDTAIAVDSYKLEGTVDRLHWCNDWRLLYRLTQDGESVLVEGFPPNPTVLTSGDVQVLGCIDG
ncbi:MAG: hypothetical protein M3220_19045 [Chloroflexota bacterium]|nr:hypothetical protein [Chloroflexota bacterium]